MNPGSTPFAAPDVAGSAAGATSTGFGDVTLALVLVLLAIFACAWVVRRLRTFGRPPSRQLALLDDLAVGHKERVVLVGVGGKRLLIGVAAGSVNLLQVLPDESNDLVVAQNAALAVSPAGAKPDFKSLLRRSLGLP